MTRQSGVVEVDTRRAYVIQTKESAKVEKRRFSCYTPPVLSALSEA